MWLLGTTGLNAAYICLSLIEKVLWLWNRCLYKAALLTICHLLRNWLRSNHSHILSWIPNTWSIIVVSPWHLLFHGSSLSCLCSGCCRNYGLLIDCHHGWILSGSRSKMRSQLTSDTPNYCWHHLLTHWASPYSYSSSLVFIHSPWYSWPTSLESWIHAHLHVTWW